MLDDLTLFGDDPEWVGMPEFSQEDRRPLKRIVVNFSRWEDYEAFADLTGQSLTRYSDTMWYPHLPNNVINGVKRYAASQPKPPRWPIYVVSKGRPECITSRELTTMGVPHYVVVEEDQRAEYEAALSDLATVLVLDPTYQRDYVTCDDLGDSLGKGPGPARNFAWDHAAYALNAGWHWVMDDNIRRFHRLNRNIKIPVADGTMIAVMEDFADRYENVGMAGPNYMGLAKQRDRLPPYVLNTRIYSCNLIRNDLPFRWRGRYNEDTDLSLRMLKAGWVTVQFNAFLQEKVMTQRMPGGNTDDLYLDSGTLPKSQMLADLHPDVATVEWKFNRWHHHVDYSRFKKNILHRRSGVSMRDGVDDFGMVYEERVGEAWEAV
jgi:hypothetical protein